MALDEGKEIQDLTMEALERDPQRPTVLHYWPSIGMSRAYIPSLSTLLEKKGK